MSEPRFKPGQFISTTKGRMRVKKSHNNDMCHKCALSIKDKDGNTIGFDCNPLYEKYDDLCCCLIGDNCYLEKV